MDNQNYQAQQGYPQYYGQPPQQPIPTQNPINKWNWGAFMFTVYWGIGNRTYLPLLCFVPLLNIAWPFVCGFKGNEWAWQSGHFKDFETFMAVQDTWNRAGKICFFVSLGVVVFVGIIWGLALATIFGSLRYYF